MEHFSCPELTSLLLLLLPLWQNYLSRNFYNLRFLALFLAFALNFILLFYKVKPFSHRFDF